MKTLRISAGIILALALVGVCAWMWAIAWAPARSDYAQQGIDVSDEAGKIDWFTARSSNLDFAYARATVGADVRDALFAENWAGIYEAGIRRGALHAFSLCQLASDQAGNFTATVPRDADALPVAIDLSFRDDCPARPERDVLLVELRQLAATIETHSGKPVILRISPDFEAQYQVSGAIDRPLWSTGMFFPPAYSARPWRLWQASTIRRIEGAERPVNWNVIAP
ncbi:MULTISPECIES: GH25 family lysozyme [unclassified Sphingomonas]|uniref:GH25 family lysozyme n=1 Tax=unclassified Sphingomonas TaxID=196159 RepID=UPI00083361A7|nr:MULTISPECIES: GH25 family lysozyme [unclassified Sphingomonas]